MVWLQPVTASTGRAGARVGTCAPGCMHVCREMCACTRAHACPMLEPPWPHPGVRETRGSNPGCATNSPSGREAGPLTSPRASVFLIHRPGTSSLCPDYTWELLCGSQDHGGEESIWETVNLIQKHTLLSLPHNQSSEALGCCPPTNTTAATPGMPRASLGEVAQWVAIVGQKLRCHAFRPFPLLEPELKIPERRTPAARTHSFFFFAFCARMDVLSFCVPVCFVSCVWRCGWFGLVWFGSVWGGLPWRRVCFVLFDVMFLFLP